MESDYDRKFKEMKSYIPFLESMISRLETTNSTAVNPRQAQLDKIRSLRDLLLDEKKRMKMENLLKCEQVLINLYTKVEQRETLPGIEKSTSLYPDTPKLKDETDLNTVRHKLKNVVSKTKLREHVAETLPEIARASESEIVCSPGSKEPALFQRRPNKGSISPSKNLPGQIDELKSPQKSVPKRHYTRVLKSPDRGSRRWISSEDSPLDRPLYSRRSPRSPPRRYSPSYYKKERKKSSNVRSLPKDFNITLNVPEDSLNSLNTEDIFTRIINCHNSDVDIDTLRDLRDQILGELKETGANNDISDLILKSYKRKKKKSTKRKKEVEEGEISDSESEAIENIYGSLVLVDKDKSDSSPVTTSAEKVKKPHKIQIRLVINKEGSSDNAPEANKTDTKNTNLDGKETVTTKEIPEVEKKELIESHIEKQSTSNAEQNKNILELNTSNNKEIQSEVITIDDDYDVKKQIETVSSVVTEINKDESGNSFIDLSSNFDTVTVSLEKPEKILEATETSVSFKANFYKPMNEQKISNITSNDDSVTQSHKFGTEKTKTPTEPNKSRPETHEPNKETVNDAICKDVPASQSTVTQMGNEPVDNVKDLECKKIEELNNVKIPLLNLEPTPAPAPKKSVVSEIDILQALKNDILSESLAIPGAEIVTPPLHQPKITKVANAQAIMPKKRISIEKYKEKSSSSAKMQLSKEINLLLSKEVNSKKQSIKLTEKECERFNFPARLSLDGSSDEEEKNDINLSLNDIYGDLAPKSPENEDKIIAETLTPIIIPVDPVKTKINSKADVDMRVLTPIMSPISSLVSPISNIISPIPSETAKNERPEKNKRPPLLDPRVRREFQASPNPHAINPDRPHKSVTNFHNMTPSRTPSMTPSRTPSMTPNARTYEMTPSLHSFDRDEIPPSKHVYAPILPVFEPRDSRDYGEKSVSREGQRQGPIWEPRIDISTERNNSSDSVSREGQRQGPIWEPRIDISTERNNSSDYQKSRYSSADSFQSSSNDRYNQDTRDDYSYSRLHCPLTPVHPFGRSDGSTTPTPSFGRLDAPLTPVHSFGRSECPTTPLHPFGRSDCPSTPSHSFGRSECPMTPSHPFGRLECPMTPNHPFGRSEVGMTPTTPSHSFGRSDYPSNNSNRNRNFANDPRVNRNNYEKHYRNYDSERDRIYNSKSDFSNRSYKDTDSYRNYSREQSVGRSDMTMSYDPSGRHYERDHIPHRELSMGRTIPSNYEDEQFHTRERSKPINRDTNPRGLNVGARMGYRAQSVGRTMPSNETFNYSSNRASSIGRSSQEENYDNQLSIKPQSGRSFVIDTRVDRTFQEILNSKGIQVFDHSFDARRQRASSVGRSLGNESKLERPIRESNVGRTLPKTFQSKPNTFDLDKLRNGNNFTRARSVGRDMTEALSQKSLKDIKADFKFSSADFKKKLEVQREKLQGKANTNSYKSNANHAKQAYSPRKNCRDPRMRREQQYERNNKYRDRKSGGIVYSNDNIAKGTVLNSSFGVKNYKIPKIQRNADEKEEKGKADKAKDTQKIENTDKCKLDDKKGKVNTHRSKVDTGKQHTKSAINNKKSTDKKSYRADGNNEDNCKPTSVNKISQDRKEKKLERNYNDQSKVFEEDIKIIRKSRKPVIHDSDSDSGEVSKEEKSVVPSTCVAKLPETQKNKNEDILNSEKENEKNKPDILDSGFDLEMFPENIASDPVLINALIADLDNELDAGKNDDESGQFTKEITLENMLDNISSPEVGNFKPFVVEESFNNISDLIDDNISMSKAKNENYLLGDLNVQVVKENIDKKITESQAQKENSNLNTEPQRAMTKSVNFNETIYTNATPQPDKQRGNDNLINQFKSHKTISEAIQNNLINSNLHISEKSETIGTSSNLQEAVINNETIVSTDIEKLEPRKPDDKLEEHTDNLGFERCSTPDSTINSNENSPLDTEKIVPDSTNELQQEMHSDITSTHDLAKASNTDKTSQILNGDTDSQLNSIGNLLSILQDKSKIKQLLQMLGTKSSDNEKIKKKLEKLSEIVSDEEDANQEEILLKTDEKQLVIPGESKYTKDETVECQDKVKSAFKAYNNDIEKNEENVDVDHTKEEEGDNSKDNDGVDKTKDNDDVDKTKDNDDLENTEDTSKDNKGAIKMNTERESTNIEVENKLLVMADTEPLKVKGKPPPRKIKKGKRKKGKKGGPIEIKRVTRASLHTEKPKRASRELKLLQEDIKEMFSNDDILNATGIRMCRLAKLVDEKNVNPDEELKTDTEPVVVLQKVKVKESAEEGPLPQKIVRKKPGSKTKPKILTRDSSTDRENMNTVPKCKPGPKSKTKPVQNTEQYASDSDSVSDATTIKDNDMLYQSTSESENESIASSKSFWSSEVLADGRKKPKRKRPGWQAGVIKPKKRKKTEVKPSDHSIDDDTLMPQKPIDIPDMNCFTDKTYCFLKNVSTYSCRLCVFNCSDIVHHYKTHHPHSEIPLSRMHPVIAREAISQCVQVDFQAISRVPSDKYICRFCFKEFGRSSSQLEAFFWHVVSMHTGEYKRHCTLCANVARCPFNLDIPSPPEDFKKQLIGYICGKCNYTQISLENLKTHVIVRHNDEQTEVCMVNLAVMSKKSLSYLMNRAVIDDTPRVLRSSRSNPSVSEPSDDRCDITEGTDRLRDIDSVKKSYAKAVEPSILESLSKVQKIQSKIAFEKDDNTYATSNDSIKMEEPGIDLENRNEKADDTNNEINIETEKPAYPAADILDYPHFKISFNEAGTKEYVCCINRQDNHYRTSLLISMKRHVQTKHTDNWDGYCFICKVIVTPQGEEHRFKECLQHLLDNHMDDLPVLELLEQPVDRAEKVPPKKPSDDVPESETPEDLAPDDHDLTFDNTSDAEAVMFDNLPSLSKTYVDIRPLAEHLFKKISEPSTEKKSDAFPKIRSVISLGAAAEPPVTGPFTPVTMTSQNNPSKYVQCSTTNEDRVRTPTEPYKYEEAQADVLTRKNPVVRDTMLQRDKLTRIFKCTGRYCSFTSDSANDALLHALTHQRIGGENTLKCAYCNYDCAGNVSDLVMHVFKNHGRCQFTCSLCFYRAAASQLVRAHAARVHGQLGVVLQSATVTPGAEDAADMLPRERAVQYFVCAEAEGACNFKTYTQEKFFEHLERHTPPYSCYICKSTLPDAAKSVDHMKVVHNLKLYQCTWCVHGCDDEADVLAHASAQHPSKQPQAYVRIITHSKGIASKRMVLPLGKFNKSTVPTEMVTSIAKDDDPIRDAERSRELENLFISIAVTTNTSNASGTASENAVDTVLSFEDENDGEPLEEPLICNDLETDALLLATPRLKTPPPVSIAQENSLSEQVTPVLKLEPTDDTPVKKVFSNPNVIYCLDSDDEDYRKSATEDPKQIVDEHTRNVSEETGQNIIDLSEDESKTNKNDKFEKIPLKILYKCPKCKVAFKTFPVLKRHVRHTCMSGHTGQVQCTHCPLELDTVDLLFVHYHNDHEYRIKDPRTRDPLAVNENRYACGICNRRDSVLSTIKKHVKEDHGIHKLLVTSKHEEKGDILYTVCETPKAKTIKRKLSLESAAITPVKRKRYGPNDVNLLPTKPILDESVNCSLCEFNTKVRLNMVRHLQQHADLQPVAHSAPVNPVPHLETHEKHFDKMVNLASSSLVPKASVTDTPVAVMISPEATSRYPKFVPERQRLTCGAKECSYISVDEAMLKRHWEALHEGSNEYHCVHCPPNQHLDTRRPLVANRILAHLKMHDVNLYACSKCSYYHCKKPFVEKHCVDFHKGQVSQVMVVREESLGQTSATQSTAPTMDLKPWQCGLCQFKSMLRPEVIEHCAKVHNTKMPFKCPNCPFRTSTLENVMKHKTNSHPTSTEGVVYYYYREGSLPDEPDGTKRWQTQRRQMGYAEPRVKTEETDKLNLTPLLGIQPSAPAPASLDLSLVKQEIDPEVELSIEDLCKRFGQFCEPNGLKYKCPLCKVVIEDKRETMQSHLYEELKYRKWGCSICTYKAFHKTGLKEHMTIEHRQNRDPIELPLDTQVEKWTSKLLEHQSTLIEINRQNLTKEKPNAPSSSKALEEPAELLICDQSRMELEQAFGQLGSPKSGCYSCPKCEFQVKEEATMRDHLESELNMIRWQCNICLENFQKYHEAQLHCKSVHAGLSARPVEAIRNPTVRAAWISAVMRTQKLVLNSSQLAHLLVKEPRHLENASDPSDSIENSLLVVRYEEGVPTPEEEMLARRNRPTHVPPPPPPPAPTPPAGARDAGSDDERLVIDEELEDVHESKKKGELVKCLYCDFTTNYRHSLHCHTLRHYNKKPLVCTMCDFQGYVAQMKKHFVKYHPHDPPCYKTPPIPAGPPLTLVLNRNWKPSSHADSAKTKEDELKTSEGPKLVCLVCEKPVPETETQSHVHEKLPVSFARKGDVVVKCCICLTLCVDVCAMQEHQNACHPTAPINYAFFKLNYDTREIQICDHCSKRFKFVRDLRSHHNAVHSSLQLKYTTKPYTPGSCDFITVDDEEIANDKAEVEEASTKNKTDDESVFPPPKRIAKKSTTKSSLLIAKKSTTKLPANAESDPESDDEFSYYGRKPTPLDEFGNVTTITPICNTMKPLSVKQVTDEIVKIDPKVVIKDVKI